MLVDFIRQYRTEFQLKNKPFSNYEIEEKPREFDIRQNLNQARRPNMTNNSFNKFERNNRPRETIRFETQTNQNRIEERLVKKPVRDKEFDSYNRNNREPDFDRRNFQRSDNYRPNEQGYQSRKRPYNDNFNRFQNQKRNNETQERW